MPRIRHLPDMDRLPRPVFARKETLAADSASRVHVHPWAQLSWVSAGALIVRTPTASHVAPPQRAVWVPPGMPHEVINPGRAEMRSLYIEAETASFAPPRCRVLTVSSLARELIQAVAALPPRYDASGADGRLVAVLLDQLARLPEADFSLPWPDDPRLVTVCQALFSVPDDRRDMEAWAETAGMTARTLGRQFVAQTGLTFGRWRRRARLLAALAALENGDSVTRAALSCGYDAPSAFIAAFKEAFGVTPGNFLGMGKEEASDGQGHEAPLPPSMGG
jgi:AraC-like DNA-binding protein